MAAPVVRITKMVFRHVEQAGYTVHVETDHAGEMDITMTVAQYHGVKAQLADFGSATIPTGVAA